MKKLFLFALICVTGLMLKAQTTVTFKPDASLGKDAIIFTRAGSNDANTNFGNYPELVMITWTWNNNLGKTRSLIKFEGLSTIPTNAIISDVKLKLYGPTSSLVAPQGNSYYTGSTFKTNPVIVKQVTEDWDENTVTWNNQPQTTTANQMTIPPSVSKWNWNYTINAPELISIVQGMVNNPITNYGFMLQLETEETYRDMLFASSDNNDSALCPELEVTYTLPCNAGFSFCGSSNGGWYQFDAYTINANYNWTVNGIPVSNEIAFSSILQPGANEVCLTVWMNGNSCTQCVSIEAPISPLNNIILKNKVDQVEDYKTNNTIPSCDVIEADPIIIYPNPTKNDWTIEINSFNEEEIEIIVNNIEGKQIYSKKELLKIGQNNFTIGNNTYNKGNYILSIRSNTLNHTKKLIKE